jgi:hypothetical protein
MVTKGTLREIAADLDPLKLLEEMRAVQAHLAALANCETPPPATSYPPNLATFVAGLSSAWHAGEIRPTFPIETKPRYLRSLQKAPTQIIVASPASALEPVTQPAPALSLLVVRSPWLAPAAIWRTRSAACSRRSACYSRARSANSSEATYVVYSITTCCAPS